MDQNLKREIILDHYQNPRNKGLLKGDNYKLADMNNDSCIDHVIVEANIDNNIIKEIHFDGEACAICTSSSSVMTNVLKDKTIVEAKNIISNYYNMIDGKEYDENILEEAIVYQDISKQPNRRKCALLAWWGIDEIIKDNV